ncbi:unnamed protein product, partial [Rotaria sordida]
MKQSLSVPDAKLNG